MVFEQISFRVFRFLNLRKWGNAKMRYNQSTFEIHCNSVPIVQFKKCEKHPWRSITHSKVVVLAPHLLLQIFCFKPFSLETKHELAKHSRICSSTYSAGL